MAIFSGCCRLHELHCAHAATTAKLGLHIYLSILSLLLSVCVCRVSDDLHPLRVLALFKGITDEDLDVLDIAGLLLTVAVTWHLQMLSHLIHWCADARYAATPGVAANSCPLDPVILAATHHRHCCSGCHMLLVSSNKLSNGTCPAGRPEDLLLSVIPVPPVAIRPSVEMDGASNEDDITMKLMVGHIYNIL